VITNPKKYNNKAEGQHYRNYWWYHRWLLQKDKLEIITKIKIIARFGAKMLGATKNFFGKYFFRRIIPN